MSERPFMQLYVSDFIGDTLHLSTEQIGAYMLLLMAMWNAGGSLPDEEPKLARVVRMSVKKWRAVANDLLPFFERHDGLLQHNRLTKELQKSESKSQSRAAAGAEGGKAKALKDQDARLANAMPEPQHLPDTITRQDTPSLRSGEARKRATRLSEDWQLPKPWGDWAVGQGLPANLVRLEAEKMRDWSISAPNGACRDWKARWQNWVRKAIADAPRARAGPSANPKTPAPVAAAAARLLSSMTGQPDAIRSRESDGSLPALVPDLSRLHGRH